MVEWLSALPELHKILGATGCMLILMGVMVRWYVLQVIRERREDKADKLRIIQALDACHKQREESAAASKTETIRMVQAIERNSVAFRENTRSNDDLANACKQIAAVMRERPCLEVTPPHAHRTPLPKFGE